MAFEARSVVDGGGLLGDPCCFQAEKPPLAVAGEGSSEGRRSAFRIEVKIRSKSGKKMGCQDAAFLFH